MMDTRAGEMPEIETKLAILRVKKLNFLREKIPSWPEKISFLLSLLLVTLVVDAPENSQVAKILVVGLFMATMQLHWFTIRKLREKVDALSENSRNANT